MEAVKSTRWSFTAYEEQWSLFAVVPTDPIQKWGWQEEVCPKTQRRHYQGYIQTNRQVRFAQLKKILPGVHLEVARNWQALVNYCKKAETAVDGTQQVVENPVKHLSMAEALIRVAEARPDIHFSGNELPDDLRKKYVAEYDGAVATLLREDKNLIGLYSQPQYERAYVKWRSVWVGYADEKTDRQTDIRSETESVVSGADSWEGAFDRS